MKELFVTNYAMNDNGKVELVYRRPVEDEFKYDFAHRGTCAEIINELFEMLPKALVEAKASNLSTELSINEVTDKDSNIVYTGEITKEMFTSPVPLVNKVEFDKLPWEKLSGVYYDLKGIGKLTTADTEEISEKLINEIKEDKKVEERVIDVQFEQAAKNGKESAEVISKKTSQKVSRSLYSKVKGSKAIVGLGSIIGQLQIIAWTCSDKEKEGYNALLAKLIKAREDFKASKNDEEAGQFKKVICVICQGFLKAMEVILGVLQFGVDVIAITIKWAWNISKSIVTQTVKSGTEIVDAFDKDVIDIFR